MLPPKKRSPATCPLPKLVDLLNLASPEILFASPKILFKEPAVLCIPVATVGNENQQADNRLRAGDYLPCPDSKTKEQ
jgi:hypothetical protein